MKSIKQKKSEKNILSRRGGEMKTYSLNEMIDSFIGKKGTKERHRFDYKLEMEMLGCMIKSARKKRNLTQEQLASLAGLQKSRISKLENSANSATVGTIIRIFQALKAEIHFNVTINSSPLKII
jgi:HTH-type transcriptional regulator/antitoxin HipB